MFLCVNVVQEVHKFYVTSKTTKNTLAADTHLTSVSMSFRFRPHIYVPLPPSLILRYHSVVLLW